MELRSEKRHAHELIDRLSGSEISTAIRFLEFMLLNPVARAVAMARTDDEPVSEEDRSRFHEGQEWFRQRGGKGIPMEEVLAEFDLTLEDFPSSRRGWWGCIR